MDKTQAIDRLERAIAAIQKMPDDFDILNVFAVTGLSWHDETQGIHVSRYEYDGKDETAIYDYSARYGFPYREREDNDEKWLWRECVDDNGTVVYQLIRRNDNDTGRT